MVVLAAALCTKAGKPLVSRQFIDMPRSRIEGLLASFPKLMSTGQQHTTIDTEAIRYVYQPMDTLYMVLITNRQSNIVQDIGTLQLFARATTDVCGGGSVQEMVVLEHCFELLCAFDEIINLGLRENISMAQLKTIMEMESQEEKIQDIIEKNKEKEAKEELKRRAKQFDMQRKEANRRGGSGSGSFANSISSFTNTMKSAYSPLEPTISTFDNEPSSVAPKSTSSKPTIKGRGMKLGGKKDKATSGLFSQEAELAEQLESKLQLEEEAPVADIYKSDVHIEVVEHISAVVGREGGVEALEIKGELTLLVADPDKSNLSLQVQLGDDSNMQIKTHPHVDKKRFQNNAILALKDASRSFPINQPVGLFKWRLVSQDDACLPLSINCWPSATGDGKTEVNIEYELESDDLQLKDVVISIPLPSGVTPIVGNVDGDYAINSRMGVLEWQLPLIDRTNKSGCLEFTAPVDDAEAFFPVEVAFQASTPFCDVDITDVALTSDGSTVEFSKMFSLTTDDYRIV